MTGASRSEPEAADATRATASGAVVRLFWQSAVYSLGNLGLKVAGLLLLPLYLDPALLSQADYGYLGLLETAAQLAIAMTGLGVASGLLRYGTMSSEEAGRDGYLVTAFVITALAAVMAATLVLLLAGPLAEVVLNDAARAPVLRWAGLYVALKVVGSVPYMLLRVRERPVLFLIALLVEVAVLVAGVWYALAVQQAGLEGVMAAFAVSAAASAIPLSVLVLAEVRAVWRPDLARHLLRFGLPLSVASLAGILLNTGDRFVLEGLAGAEVLAVYVLATKFGGLINMLFVQSFNMGFAVLGLKSIDAERDTDFHRRVFRHFVVLAGWGVLGVSLLARDLTDLLSPNPAYLQAEPLILPIAFGFLLYGIYYIIVNVLYARERTGRIALLVLVAAAFNIALNFALIPVLGAMGAALATLAAYAGLVGISLWQARGTLSLRLPWSVLIVTVLWVVGLWALGQPSAEWGVLPRLGVRMSLIAAFPALVVASGIYRRGELRALLSTIRARR